MAKTKITGDLLGDLDEGVTLNESATPAIDPQQGAIYVSDGTDGLTQGALVFAAGSGTLTEVGSSGGVTDLANTLAAGSSTGGSNIELTTGDLLTGQTELGLKPAVGDDVVVYLSAGGALFSNGGYWRISEFDYNAPSPAGTLSVFAAATTTSPTRFQKGLYVKDDTGRTSRLDIWEEGQDSGGDPYLSVNPEAGSAHLVLSPNGSGAIQASITDGTATGGDPRGTAATDLQRSRSQPDQVANGNYSTISGGSDNRANGARSTVCGGVNNTAWGFASSVLGGNENVANGSASVVMGRYAQADQSGEVTHSADRFAQNGDAQYSRYVLSVETPDPNPHEMLTGGDRIVLQDNTAIHFKIEVVAKEIGSTATAWWSIDGCIVRAAGPATVVFVGPVGITKHHNTGAGGWDVQAVAGVVNGALELRAQSNQPEPVRFVATVRATKVGA